MPRLAPHYVLELSRDGRLDAMSVVVEARPDAPTPRREIGSQ